MLLRADSRFSDFHLSQTLDAADSRQILLPSLSCVAVIPPEMTVSDAVIFWQY
jgi:hypothetical protein